MDLRIGIGTGGEVTVRLFLFFYYRNVSVTGFFQSTQHRLQASPVQRRVNDSHVFIDLRIPHYRLLLHLFHESGVHLFRDPFNAAGFQALFKRNLFAVRKQVQLFDLAQHFIGSRGGHLAAVSPVHLVAVVLGGVVGSRYHNARRAFQIPGSVGNAGYRHQLGENISFDAISRKDFRRNLRKHIALDAAVVADGNAPLFRSKVVDHIIAETLGSPSHNIHIHPVGAGADHAPKAGSTKLQVLVKGIFDLRPVPGHGLQFRF